MCLPPLHAPHQERIAQLGPFPADLMGYQARKGMPELRQAIKNMLETTFMKVSKTVTIT